MPGKEKEIQAQIEKERLAYELYSPIIKIPKDQNQTKRNMDTFFEKQGSRLAHYANTKDNNIFSDEFNSMRLRLATAATQNRSA